MKAPVSWIKEYVDLPADVTTEELAGRLPALGPTPEARGEHGAPSAGPTGSAASSWPGSGW